MPISQALIDELKAKLTAKIIDGRPYLPPAIKDLGEPINLETYKDQVTAVLAEDETKLLNGANTNYYKLSEFIEAMNPYGGQAIIFPDLDFASTDDRLKIADLRAKKGIEVAGWLRGYHSQKPKKSSDEEMTLVDEAQCFYWDFRYPDDPTHAEGAEPPHGGEMKNLQITKAIRIPFVYRREDALLLLGHILIGYEGAGSM